MKKILDHFSCKLTINFSLHVIISLSFQKSVSVVVLPQFAKKNHLVMLSLLPPPQWNGEENQKVKGKTRGLRWEQFNRVAKGEKNNNQ